jgi:transcriptional regulator with XRE-family HTH domain
MIESPPVEQRVGRHIRAIRESRGLSLRALGGRCGLSPNAISLIERGENSATVGSLHALATALGVSVSDFFREEPASAIVLTRAAERVRTESGGMRLESLGSGLADQRVEPFMMTLEPGSGLEAPVSHMGEEFIHLLAGEIEYRVDGRVFALAAGDSLLFKAALPHRFHNVGTGRAVMLVVFRAGAGNHLAPSPAQGGVA